MEKQLQYLIQAVEEQSDVILKAERHIWANPESGYREWKTQEYVASVLEGYGYQLTYAGDIPGFWTVLDTGRPGPTVCIFAEMDSLIDPLHPECDPETKAAHTCGHHCQSAVLIGVAAALAQPRALEGLSGKIKLLAVPAEEMIEGGYRQGLIDQGTIQYLTGKAEFYRRGYFDDVDIMLGVHSGGAAPGLGLAMGLNGSSSKRVVFHGTTAHAAFCEMAPNVANAMYAATLAMSACNALRETFPAGIKWHPILPKCGEAVNAIPNHVVMESMVRGPQLGQIVAVNDKINRAIAGAAAALGVTATVVDQIGYAPTTNDQKMMSSMREVYEELFPGKPVSYFPGYAGGSGDLGFLSDMIPSLQASVSGGCNGVTHGSDFGVFDPVMACVDPVKVIVGYVWKLLQCDAALAQDIRQSFQPKYPSREACVADWNRLNQTLELVTMEPGKKITLQY